MPRNPCSDQSTPTPAPSLPHVVQPNAIYRPDQLRAALGLKRSTLRREIRLGRLRVAKRSGKYFFRGLWVLEWIAAGEIVPANGIVHKELV